MKAIICMFIPQPPLCPTLAYGEFYWSPVHKCHVWGGQTKKPIELSMQEFNKLADKLLHEHDFFGKRTVRLIEEAPAAVAPPLPEPTAPVLTPSPALAMYSSPPVLLTAATRPRRGTRRRSQRPTRELV